MLKFVKIQSTIRRLDFVIDLGLLQAGCI